MWHSSYGELAAQRLEEWRAEAAELRLMSAEALVPRQDASGSARARVGAWLVRLGERIGGGSARPVLR